MPSSCLASCYQSHRSSDHSSSRGQQSRKAPSYESNEIWMLLSSNCKNSVCFPSLNAFFQELCHTMAKVLKRLIQVQAPRTYSRTSHFGCQIKRPTCTHRRLTRRLAPITTIYCRSFKFKLKTCSRLISTHQADPRMATTRIRDLRLTCRMTRLPSWYLKTVISP